jgi:hypothetical protein
MIIQVKFHRYFLVYLHCFCVLLSFRDLQFSMAVGPFKVPAPTKSLSLDNLSMSGVYLTIERGSELMKHNLLSFSRKFLLMSLGRSCFSAQEVVCITSRVEFERHPSPLPARTIKPLTPQTMSLSLISSFIHPIEIPSALYIYHTFLTIEKLNPFCQKDS